MNNKRCLRTIRNILKDNNFEYLRRTKHEIWKHKVKGTKIVFGSTPKHAEEQVKIIEWKVAFLKKNNFEYQPSNRQPI